MSEVENMVDAIEKLVDKKIANAMRGGSSTVPATYMGTDSEGKAWVVLAGADAATPVRRTSVEAARGDMVSVTVADGMAVIDANLTDKSAGVASVAKADEKAVVAQETAVEAIDYASQASAAASYAQSSADSALQSAGTARIAADSAVADAARANDAATQAISDAAEAASAANAAQESAENAETAAASAQSSADLAAVHANSALDQLGIVQDVVGVLSWASEHGSFELTSDTSIQDGKVYFTYDQSTGDYVPVVEPQASALSTYYELTVDEAMQSYIMSHLAVTSRGLWVLPNGIGSGTTPSSGETQADSDARQGGGFKMLLASGGTYIYDTNGVLVRSDTASGTDFLDSRQWHLGTENAYILYTPASGSTPAKLVIGGSNIQLGSGRMLSELLAAYDTAALSVRIDSSNGIAFKNGTGTTTLTCRVFQYGDNELDASGTAYSYKWYKDGTAISGATSKTLTVSAPSTTATYKCEVTI